MNKYLFTSALAAMALREFEQLDGEARTKKSVKAAIVPEAAETPGEAKATSAGYALMLTGVAAAGLGTFVLKGEWWGVPLALALLAVGGLWLRGEYQSRVVRTSVTGKGKTQKSSEQAE